MNNITSSKSTEKNIMKKQSENEEICTKLLSLRR